jgi:hypothetical protein
MRIGPDDGVRVVGCGGKLLEVIGTYEKTARGTKKKNERRYMVRHPRAPAPQAWPEFNDDQLSVSWNGFLCEFEPKRRNQYLLLKLLSDHRGRWVTYGTIADDVIKDDMANPTAIRQFKRRLVVTVKEAGMAGLAAAIIVSKRGEGMRLNL